MGPSPAIDPAVPTCDDQRAFSCLPDELLQRVFLYLRRRDVPAVRSACRQWRDVFDQCLETLQLAKFDFEDVDQLLRYKNVRTLVIRKYNDVLGKALRSLQSLPKLAKIHIPGNFYGFDWFCLCKSLQKLYVGPNFTISDVDALAACEQLRVLSLIRCESLEDIEGLSSCTLLEEVQIVNAELEDAGPLADCSNLRRLSLEKCHSLTTLGQLTKHTNLELLVLKDACKIGLQDLGDLTAWSGLKKLDISWSGTKSIAPLSACIGLQTLCITGCTFSHDDYRRALASCTALTHIQHQKWHDRWQEVTGGLAHLPFCTGLVCLDLKNCWVNDISGLAQCTLLQMLRLTNAQFRDVSPLSACRELHTLDLSYTGVEDVSPLTALTKLTYLCIDGMMLEDVSMLDVCCNLRQVVVGHVWDDHRAIGPDSWYRNDAIDFVMSYHRRYHNAKRLACWDMGIDVAKIDDDCRFNGQEGDQLTESDDDSLS